MRSRIGVAFVALALAGGGCTLLVEFNDVEPSVLDAAVPDDGSPPDAAVPDAPPFDGGPLPFPPACDPAFPLTQLNCSVSRPNCAKSTTVFPSYPAGQSRDDDLVGCDGGLNPVCVQHCPAGCATMPSGFPDQCDDCNGRPDGTYCVKDLREPDDRNLGLAVDCTGGRTTKAYVCGVGRCATKCPRTERAPSCCI
jgi:hypothetical protein